MIGIHCQYLCLFIISNLKSRGYKYINGELLFNIKNLYDEDNKNANCGGRTHNNCCCGFNGFPSSKLKSLKLKFLIYFRKSDINGE